MTNSNEAEKIELRPRPAQVLALSLPRDTLASAAPRRRLSRHAARGAAEALHRAGIAAGRVAVLLGACPGYHRRGPRAPHPIQGTTLRNHPRDRGRGADPVRRKLAARLSQRGQLSVAILAKGDHRQPYHCIYGKISGHTASRI